MVPLRTRRSGWVRSAALSWRVGIHRFSFVFFLVLSLGVLLVGRSQPHIVEATRARVVDGMAPVLDMLSRPLATAEQVAQRIGAYVNLEAEAARLREENAELRRWRNRAFVLENENKELRDLLRYRAEPALAYVSARVIADAGGTFGRSLIVTAGRKDGVRENMAAMTGDGLVGRVVEVGDWSSRVLLVTDLNSRLPVKIMGQGDHAIVAGDNTAHPKLLYVGPDAVVKDGDSVVTSGHGGIFPPNLPVGTVAMAEPGKAEIAPFASMSRINHVRLVDFGLQGGAFNPMAEGLQAVPPAR